MEEPSVRLLRASGHRRGAQGEAAPTKLLLRGLSVSSNKKIRLLP